MAIIESEEGSGKVRSLLLLAVGIGGVLLVGLLVMLWSGPPQMGADEEVFRSVDALFTAVTARDEKLLGQCEQRLHAQRDAGKMPTEAGEYLDEVIARARSGKWETAAERLYEFMKAQRREGADHISTRPKNRRSSAPERR